MHVTFGKTIWTAFKSLAHSESGLYCKKRRMCDVLQRHIDLCVKVQWIIIVVLLCLLFVRTLVQSPGDSFDLSIAGAQTSAGLM